jgi:hypothetical protein
LAKKFLLIGDSSMSICVLIMRKAPKLLATKLRSNLAGACPAKPAARSIGIPAARRAQGPMPPRSPPPRARTRRRRGGGRVLEHVHGARGHSKGGGRRRRRRRGWVRRRRRRWRLRRRGRGPDSGGRRGTGGRRRAGVRVPRAAELTLASAPLAGVCRGVVAGGGVVAAVAEAARLAAGGARQRLPRNLVPNGQNTGAKPSHRVHA